MLQLAWIHPGSIIRHRNDPFLLRLLAKVNLDTWLLFIHKLHRIADNVENDTLDLLCIHRRDSVGPGLVLARQTNPRTLVFHGQLIQRLPVELLQRHRFEIESLLIQIQLGVQEQVVNHSIHVERLRMNHIDILLQLLRIIRYAFPNSLHISLNRGQRRLQIMRNIRYQLFAALFHRQLRADRQLQLAAHFLVRANDAADLVANLRVQTEVQVPFCDTA
ncbi:hypothetical protein D3C77_358970 [compost metagenome]